MIFSTLEEFFESLHQSENRANAMATDEQKAITWGDYFEVLREMNSGLHAWGRIFGREELEQGERDLGADDEEIVMTLAHEDSKYERGYRFAWVYSAVEPEGEMEHVHICKMRKITEEQFNRAKENKWQ